MALFLRAHERRKDGKVHTYWSLVENHPVRAKLLKAKEPIESFRWSSYGAYVNFARQRPPWLRVDRLLGEKGIPRDSASGRREFAEGMERRRAQDLGLEFKPVERGWCLGSEQFREELLAAAKERIGATNYGVERHETESAKARRLVKKWIELNGTKRICLVRQKGIGGKWRWVVGPTYPTCSGSNERSGSRTVKSKNRHLLLAFSGES